MNVVHQIGPHDFRRAKKPDSTRRLAVSEAIPDEMPVTTAVPCCFAFNLVIAGLLWSIDPGDIQVDTCIAERMQVFTWTM